MDRLELVVQIERALVNANDSAVALLRCTESLEGERKFVVQQIVWAIQDELETISRCLKQANDLSEKHDLNQTKVVKLENLKPLKE